MQFNAHGLGIVSPPAEPQERPVSRRNPPGRETAGHNVAYSSLESTAVSHSRRWRRKEKMKLKNMLEQGDEEILRAAITTITIIIAGGAVD